MGFQSFRKWWHARQLRIALERHAVWKARKEELNKHLLEADPLYRANPYNRNRAVKAAGEEARYLERVEILTRSL